MMSPNKNKRGVTAVREASPEPGPSALSSKSSGTDPKEDDGEESIPKRGGANQYGSIAVRAFGFSGKRKPAELFRKDLISAMKLADKDSLPEESYFLISDPWRQEWEKGVQVPVNSVTDIKQAVAQEVHKKSKTGDFKMPHKLLHERTDETYKKGQHELSGMPELADQVVRYDLDDLDVSWLEEVNFRLREMGLTLINEWIMERIMEAFEHECHKNMTEVIKTGEGMGIEYDEDVVCDICRSPESEDTNEMVFCDKCDICIHQACYGIKTIPQGSWMCRTCAVGIKPTCMLCPNLGGAMKCTRSGTQWTHVSCAWWIPEVAFGDPDKMEPITKIAQIPASRWSLTCCLCKERLGACIQCSVKSCKTAFHVTCGFNEGLHMETILDDKDASEDVKLKAFCPKHSKRRERNQSGSELDTPRKKGSIKGSPHKNSPRKNSPRKNSPRKDSPPSPKKELTQEEKANLRDKKLKSLEQEFYRVVDLSAVSKTLHLDQEMVNIIFVYWKLKRKCNWDKPLLTPKTEEDHILERQADDSRVARKKMFVHIRHDLERARNLCYMISKREKMKRQLFHNKELVFKNMAGVLKNKALRLSKANVKDIVRSYYFDSIYNDYGRSVQRLPGELSGEESEGSEAEDSISACSVGAERAQKMVGGTEKKTKPQKASATSTEGSQSKAQSRRSKGTSKTSRKVGKAADVKKSKNKGMTSASEASPLPAKNTEAVDDNILIMSAEESEDETVHRLPGNMVVKGPRWKAGKNSLWSNPSDYRRVKQKKPRRGRKPWYEKQNQVTPNLTLTTDDDDDDTKDSLQTPQTERRENVSVGEDSGEENLLVDVIGDGGDSDENCMESVAKPSCSGRTVNMHQKPLSKGAANSRNNRDRTRTRSVKESGDVDIRAKVNDVPPKKSESISKENKSIKDVESVKEVPDVRRVLSFVPTRTSNRKRKTLPHTVCENELPDTKVEDSSRKSGDSVKGGAKMNAGPSEVERKSALPPAELRKSSRNRSNPKKMKFETASIPDSKEPLTGKTEQLPELPNVHQQNRLLQSSSKPAANVHDEEDNTQDKLLRRVEESRERSPSESRESSESGLPVRKKRQSSIRAQIAWNKLLVSPGSSVASQRSCQSTPERQLPDKHSTASLDDRTVNGLKIKQEKDVEKTENGGGKGPDVPQKPHDMKLLDSKKNDSKETSLHLTSDVSRRVRNGFRKRHSRQGKRRLLAMLDSKQRKIDTFFSKTPPESLDSSGMDDNRSVDKSEKCMLNGISPEKSSSWQNSRTEKRSTDVQNKPGNSVLERVCDPPRLPQLGEGSGGSELGRKKDCGSRGAKVLEDVSAFAKGQCETQQFSMDTMRAFRSQSPSSDGSTITGLRSDSRESTPHRWTRSQYADYLAENSPRSRDSPGHRRKRTLQRHRRSKAAKSAL